MMNLASNWKNHVHLKAQEDMNRGFSWYPKMLQVTWQPGEFEARFFFGGSSDLLQADPEEDELRLGDDWMDVPVIPFNIVDVHFQGFMVHSWFH